MPTIRRTKQAEHEFIQHIVDEVGITKKDIKVYAEVIIEGDDTKITNVGIEVNDRGMVAMAKISYRTNNRVAKRQALARASDEIYNKLSAQEKYLVAKVPQPRTAVVFGIYVTELH